jgi:DNA-binding SARP family transcriptional activator
VFVERVISLFWKSKEQKKARNKNYRRNHTHMRKIKL